MHESVIVILMRKNHLEYCILFTFFIDYHHLSLEMYHYHQDDLQVTMTEFQCGSVGVLEY